ncbi:response regulator [Piscinibacter defluvii]|uniref:response regulator n=1 Tax=Piscinibacter defluvii TaxID=1796922 RepID=UPI000FDE7479|nr:response regulator [Piscinibacter defluvii]
MSVPEFADRYSVALEGFSAFERESLASFFRLAAQRTPVYEPVDEAGLADFLVVDADRPAAVEAAAHGRRERDTVFIGARAPAGALACLHRPVDPLAIVRELDRLLEMRLAVPDAVSDAESGLMPLSFEEPGEAAPAAAMPQARRRPSAVAAAAARTPRGGGGRDVMVVDDSAIARKFLQQRLERFGYRVHLAASGAEALELLAQRAYALAFLDVVLGPAGSVDGLQVCQAVKQEATRRGLRTPVVLVTALKGSSDRVRGSLAGCDAYLTKPLLEEPFVTTLRQLDPAFDWPEAPAAASSA